LLWTQLADDRLIAGLIADGHHLPADTLEVMLRAKTVHRAYLVSDMTALAGRAPGRYTTPVGGEVELSADGRISYLGTQLLAGAARTLPEGLNHVTAVTSLNLDQALTLVTATPAAHIPRTRPGLAQIRPGAPADLVLLESLDGGGVRVAAAVQSGRTVLGSLP